MFHLTRTQPPKTFKYHEPLGFSKMQTVSTIFRDESKLEMSYVPRDLPNREKQLKNHFSGTLSQGVSRHVLLYGDIGTGKTVTAKKFCQIISAQARKLGKKTLTNKIWIFIRFFMTVLHLGHFFLLLVIFTTILLTV